MANTKAVAKAVNALPEFIVNSADFTDAARDGLSARSDVAEAENREKLAKQTLSDLASTLRTAEAEKDNFIGIVRVVKATTDTEDLSPVAVQFKMAIKDSTLTVDQLAYLDQLFGALRPQLWEKSNVVTEIPDPEGLLILIKEAGLNPWDFLNVSVKPGMDNIIAKYHGVVSVEGIVPKAGFLARLQEFGKNLPVNAKRYVKDYLAKALSASVTLGTKGKA